MKSITFVSTNHYVPTGGSEVLWSQAAKQLLDRGVDVSACVRNWGDMPAHVKMLREAGCQFWFAPPSAKSLPDTLRNAIRSLVKNTALNEYGRWLEKQRPDLVLFSMGNSLEGFQWMQECQRRGIPYALLVQLVSELAWLDDEQTEVLISVYSRAERCYFVSHANQKLVERLAGFKILNAQVVQNPYVVDFQAPFRWVKDAEQYRLACVASLHSLHKGQDLLMDVFKQRKWKQRPIEVNLFGEGPHRRILERLKAMWDVDQVHLRGFCDDVQNIWRSHHALVMPSRMEGMPLALKEAMVCGRPAIVTAVGGNAELVDDNVNGFVIQAPTPELLDEALERAWAVKEAWKEMGEKAYEKARRVISSNPVGDFCDQLQELANAAA